MTHTDNGPRGPIDNEIHRLRLLSEQLHTAARDVGKLWFDSWRGLTSDAFGNVRDRLAARSRRVGDLVDQAIDALTEYREILAERPAPSANGETLVAWRQRLAVAAVHAADQIRPVNHELADLPPILGGSAPAPTSPPDVQPRRPTAKPPERPALPVAADGPSPDDPGYSDHTAEVCDEFLDADFGELAEG